MRLPHSVPTYAFEAFRCSEETLLLPNEVNRTLRSENEEWDASGVPLDLKTQALRVIAENWLNDPILEELPTCVDRDYLLEILPLNISFEVAMKRIHYDHYWQRVAEARWKVNDPTEHGNSWRQLYCERHLWEYLENLDPALFESQRQDCENLLELVHEHVHVLKLRQLLPTKPRVINRSPDDFGNPPPLSFNNFERHHIPMDLILSKLPYLREIYINIGVIYMNDDFDYQDFEFSLEDSLNIGRATKKLEHLAKFSLTKSNLDQQRAAAILQGLAVNNNLQTIDFSHCKLSDQGALAIGAFLSERSVDGQLVDLDLYNNDIGPRGLSGLVRGLILAGPRRSGIRRLNLRFNPIGDEGAGYLCALFLRYRSLEYLNVSSCSFSPDGGMKLAEVLASGHAKFFNLEFDCSNNELGAIVGEAFEAVAKSCSAITEIDVRMCGFRKESENSIVETVNRNRANLKDQVSSRQSNLKTHKTRSQSLRPPLEFSIFQKPHDSPIDVHNDESFELAAEEEDEILGN